jgi:hypothetical protein
MRTEVIVWGTLAGIALLLTAYIIGGFVGRATAPDEKDACRAEIEQAYEAFKRGQGALADDLLSDALGATCISEVSSE